MTIYHILMTKYQRLFTNDYQISTNSYVRIYKLFMQNKPNFPHFSPENDDLTKNKANSNPIQTQFVERAKLMQSVYLQRIMKIYANMAKKNKPNSNPICRKNKIDA